MHYLTTNVKANIKKLAGFEVSNESCGLILQDNDSFVVCTTDNVAQDKKNSFAIPHSAWFGFKTSGKLLAIWHSHPPPCDDGLSELDKLMSERVGVDFVVYDTSRDKFVVYEPKGYEVPYIGRPFVVGVFDCWSLVSDWYQRELNIELRDIPHPIRDVSGFASGRLLLQIDASSRQCFKTLLEDRGLFEINMQEKNKGDILLMNDDRIISPVHVAIYLGNDRILHHPEDSESLEENFSEYWRRSTVKCFRHKSL